MKAVRKLLFWLHLSVGCVAGVVILTMSLTGAMLAFERQIKTHTDAPASLQAPSDNSQRLLLDEILAKLKDNRQGVPTQLVLRNRAGAPIEARFGRSKVLFLNPRTAEIVGQPSETTEHFFSTVEGIHRSLGLGMQSSFGRGITGAANLGFLFLLMSGAYLWLPRIFNASNIKSRLLFRRRLSGRAREWNWHNTIGAWTVIPLFFLVLTGVIMSYPWASNLLFRMTGSQPPSRGFRGEARGHRAPSHDGSLPSTVQFRSLEEIGLIAKQQTSAWNSITLDVPDPEDRTMAVSIDTSPGGQPDKASQLVIQRQSGRIESVKRFSDNNLGSKLRVWARFTHTGEEFGIFGEAIAALACCGAIMLVYTGLAMALRRAIRTISSRKSGAATATTAKPEVTAMTGV
jgi:uncharacterized iron-regulated membrane protein